MPDTNTQKSENYIRQYAINILTYEDCVASSRVQLPDLESLSPKQVLEHYLDGLRQPPVPADARNVLCEFKKLVEGSRNHFWNERVTKYVQSIFPPPILPPFSGKSTAIDFNPQRAVSMARWMSELDYMFTKPPDEWREWKLLNSRPYDIQEIQSSLGRLQTDHGKYLHVFCDADGSLRAPSYNDMIGFLKRIAIEADPNAMYGLRHALEGVLVFFQENSVYRLIFNGQSVKKWEMDFFRFERPDTVEEQRNPGGWGTVRIVMPAGCVDVGLKNHFPHKAYKVVAKQVSPLQGKSGVLRGGSGLEDAQFIQLIVAVMEETRGGCKLFKAEVMDKLQAKSKELFDQEATSSSAPHTQTRFFRDRLGKISEEVGSPGKGPDMFDRWLIDLKNGEY